MKMWVPKRSMQAELVIQTNKEGELQNRANDQKLSEGSSSSLSIVHVRPDGDELSEGISSCPSIVDLSPSISNSNDSSYIVVEVASSISDCSGTSFSPNVEGCQDQRYLSTSLQTPVPLETPISSDNCLSPELEGFQDESYFPNDIQTALPVETLASLGNSLSPTAESSQNETNSPPALQTPVRVESPVLLCTPLPHCTSLITPTEVTLSEPTLRYERFEGRHRKDCEEWLTSFEDISIANGESSNTDRTRIFGGLMKGARNWYTCLPKVTKEDWIELKKAFLQEFKVEVFPYNVFVELLNIKMEEKESARKVVQKVQRLTRKLHPDLYTTMWCLHALPHEMRSHVLKESPTSPQEVQKAAKSYEDAEYWEKVRIKEKKRDKKRNDKRKKKSERRRSSGSSSFSSSDFGDSETDSGPDSCLGNSPNMNTLTMNSSYHSTSYRDPEWPELGRAILHSPWQNAPRHIIASQSSCQAPTRAWIEHRQNFHRRMHWPWMVT